MRCFLAALCEADELDFFVAYPVAKAKTNLTKPAAVRVVLANSCSTLACAMNKVAAYVDFLAIGPSQIDKLRFEG